MTVESTTSSHVTATASLGTRLRAGREALGLSVADAAAKLRVSVTIVEAIERDDLDRLGAAVYARGYLTSFARMVGLPVVVVASAVQRQLDPMPPLHSASQVSHGRFLMDRYVRRAASIVLTASIVVPVVWLATEERLPVQPVTLRSLDAVSEGGIGAQLPATGLADSLLLGPPASLAGIAAPAGTLGVEPDMAVMASFAPFMGARGDVHGAAASELATDSAVAADASGWLLRFSGDSWVEITNQDGVRLEFGVIRGGSERRYPSAVVAKIALGNASVVEVLRDGQPLSLLPFQRANVARFAVSSGGELKPAGG